MKTTVSFYDFRDMFDKIRPNNFTYEGLSVLFDYLEECERDCGEEHEVDVIALCCDFAECHWTDIANDYKIDLSEIDNDDDKCRAVGEYLNDEGYLIGEVEGGFVYRQH